MWLESPARRMATWAALGLAGALAGEVLARFVLDAPALSMLQPLVVVIALALGLAAGAISGTRAALAAGTVGGLYAVSVLLRYSSNADLLARLMTGLVVGVTILALSAYVGYARTAQARMNERVLAGERENARALEAHNRELSAANDVLRDFAHVVAHDLKEPIRGIDVLLEALHEEENDRLSAEGRELLARAQAAERRLAGLVDALLDYARATRISPGDLQRLDVCETLSSDLCRARYANLVRERDAHVEMPRPGCPRVLATQGALSLVLGNLISNAIRHNPGPSPRVRVRVEEEQDGWVALVVEDDGPGFSPEALARTEAMLRGHEPPTSLGRSGFGLLLVTRAVERMNGRIQLGRSALGGAEVRILLPAGKDVTPPEPQDMLGSTRPVPPPGPTKGALQEPGGARRRFAGASQGAS